ncbi:acylphosphatase [Phycicoccus sonneratiae]|uniref:Acylphosphatase n=1 Tax=Phycicoccus sonneratiae TaxID=2807628 RepID=A0ABS2CKQ5_9MICO|nr:acylphosphatase [Phycicoccus sonneraticus]MBM6400461.1 acylphosphatase [Phycicoccus sonneraticus]
MGADEQVGDDERATVFVRGQVQGVGFRWWTRARALELGLAGWARNTADGRVEVAAEGPRPDIEALHALLRDEPSGAGRPGRVTSVSAPLWSEPKGETGFRER